MLSNFIIYYNNLSTCYILCVIVSVIAVALSWIFHFKNVPTELNFDAICEGNLGTNTEENEFKNILTSFKEQRKQTIEKIAANLTEDQLEAEKQIEREQLAAILKLLKEQEDKFQVGTMEELEGQLKLYR